MLVTGSTVSAQKALHLGIVDALITRTSCSQKSEYTWLLDVLEFIKQKHIGNSLVTIPKGVHDIYPSVASSMRDEEILSLPEDQLSSTFKSRNEYEKKFSSKYQ